jgi:hypothetical protein
MGGLLGVTMIDPNKRVVTLRRCKFDDRVDDDDDYVSLDVSVHFKLGPIHNWVYGSVNYQGTEISNENFKMEIFDSTKKMTEQVLFADPVIRPAWLGVSLNISTNRSAERAKFSWSFKLSNSLLAKDETVLFLPKRVAVEKSLVVADTSIRENPEGVLWTTVPNVNLQLDRVFDSNSKVMQRVARRSKANRELKRHQEIKMSIENIFASVGGQREKDTLLMSTASGGDSATDAWNKSWEKDIPQKLVTLELFSLQSWSTRIDNWPKAQAEADVADHCFWIKETTFGGIVTIDIDEGNTSSPSLVTSCNVPDNQVTIHVTFTTKNPFPKNGMIVTSFPDGYRAEAQVKPCSVVFPQLNLTFLLQYNTAVHFKSDPFKSDRLNNQDLTIQSAVRLLPTKWACRRRTGARPRDQRNES